MHRKIATLVLAALGLATLAATAEAAARRPGALVVRQVSFEQQAQTLLAGFNAASAEILLIDKGCCADVPKCCYTPCISYRYHHCRKVCCGCEPPKRVVLKVKDPCCCCFVEVPVCLPACCQGEPCVAGHCGLFGRGIVEYSWACGFKVRVALTKHGDVRVTYFGA